MAHFSYTIHKNGPALWPEHKPLTEVLQLKRETTDQVWSGTYQGVPSPPGGSVFKREWWPAGNRFDIADEGIVNECYARYISWDTAKSELETADYTAYTVAELWPDYRLGIRMVKQERLEFPNLTALMQMAAITWNRDNKLRGIIIEDKDSGTSALQTLRHSAPTWLSAMLVPFIPTTDKVTRANQAAVWCKLGCVRLPRPAMDLFWLADFEDELFDFPQAAHDDRVDSFVQIVLYLEHLLSAGRRARGDV